MLFPYVCAHTYIFVDIFINCAAFLPNATVYVYVFATTLYTRTLTHSRNVYVFVHTYKQSVFAWRDHANTFLNINRNRKA